MSVEVEGGALDAPLTSKTSFLHAIIMLCKSSSELREIDWPLRSTVMFAEDKVYEGLDLSEVDMAVNKLFLLYTLLYVEERYFEYFTVSFCF